jgi:polysaccharide biosynthesis transport protein
LRYVMGFITGLFSEDSGPWMPTLPEKEAIAVALLRENTSVRRIGQTLVLEIRHTAYSRRAAADIVNAIGDSYLREQIQAKYDATQRATLWMQERIGELRDQANSAARLVQEFKAKNNLIDTQQGGLIGDQQIAEITSQLVLARAQTSESKARLNQANSILNGPIGEGTITDALKSEVVNHLRQQLLEASMRERDISKRYGSTHQVAMRARDEVLNIRRSLQSELQRMADTFKSEYEISKTREESLQAALATHAEQQAVTNQARVQLRELESAALTYSTLYETFLRKQTEAMQQQSFPLTEARVITPGSPPFQSSHPRTAIIMALAVAAGGVLGLGLAIMRESLDHVFRTPESLEHFTGLRCISIVPKVKARSYRRSASSLPPGMSEQSYLLARGGLSHAVRAPLSAFAEGIRSIKVSIDLVKVSGSAEIIGVTSSVPNEGKTTITGNLAQLIAQSGRTCLLIDTDLRNPSLSRTVARETKKGLVDVLCGEESLENVLSTSFGGKLMFLPAGHVGAMETSEVLRSSSFRLLLEQAAERFDYVLLDLPPLAPLVDVRAVSPLVNRFVVVVEWAKTDKDVLKQALERNGPEQENQILGLVLNKVDPSALKEYPTYRFDTYLKPEAPVS